MSVSPRVLTIAAICALLLAPPVRAQDVGTMPLPKGEVSVGYSFMRDFTDIIDDSGTNFPAGWYFSGAINTNQWLGLVGEVTGAYKNLDESAFGVRWSTKMQVYTLLGGPRFFHKTGRVVPFGQFLAGVAHARAKVTLPVEVGGSEFSDDATDFAIQPGGGLTVLLTENVGVRVAGDYRCIIDFAGSDENQYTNELRFITGFTFHWGAR